MDFGIGGRRALVCGASSGLGLACASALAGEGVDLVINGRNPEKLADAAEALRQQFGVNVTEAPANLSTKDGIEAVLAVAGEVDILVNNSGGTPVGDLRTFEPSQWHDAVDANMLPAIMLTKAVIDGMAERGFGRIVNITVHVSTNGTDLRL